MSTMRIKISDDLDFQVPIHQMSLDVLTKLRDKFSILLKEHEWCGLENSVEYALIKELFNEVEITISDNFVKTEYFLDGR